MRAGIPVLVDGAQAVAHMPVDVQALGCDFYAMSGHKLFGTDGHRRALGPASALEKMPPYQGGGDMISAVSFARTDVQRRAEQVRGRHAEHRRIGRSRRGD
jgi:cysteine desulfurase/selenocysteine lyase